MAINWLAVLVAAIVPTITGFIWYNPKVFGTAWMQASGMTEEKMKGTNMGLIFGLSFFFSLLLALSMNALAIHQSHIYSIMMYETGFGDPNSEVTAWITDFMSKYGMNGRSFGHGAVHGVFTGIFVALPILATNSLFERKGGKYIMVNVGYWIVTLAIMGAIVCGWV